MVAAFLEDRLSRRGVRAHVTSAGRLAGGRPTTPENVTVMRRYGFELAEHRSQQATPSLVQNADLILAAAQEHVEDAVGLAPQVLPHAFTLKELVRLGAEIGVRGATEPLSEWLRRAAEARDRTRAVGPSPSDDLPDPIGQPLGYYEQLAAEIAGLVTRLVGLAWPVGSNEREPADQNRG